MSKNKIKIEEGTYVSIFCAESYGGLEVKVPNRNVRNAIRTAKSITNYLIYMYFYDKVEAEMPYDHKGTQIILHGKIISNKSSRIYYPDAKLLTSAEVKKVVLEEYILDTLAYFWVNSIGVK